MVKVDQVWPSMGAYGKAWGISVKLDQVGSGVLNLDQVFSSQIKSGQVGSSQIKPGQVGARMIMLDLDWPSWI